MKFLSLVLVLVSFSQIAVAQVQPAGTQRRQYVYCQSNQGYYPEVKLDLITRNGGAYVLAGTAIENFQRSQPRNVKFGGLIDNVIPGGTGTRYTFRQSNYTFLDGASRRLTAIFVGNASWGMPPRVALELDGRTYDVQGCQLK